MFPGPPPLNRLRSILPQQHHRAPHVHHADAAVGLVAQQFLGAAGHLAGDVDGHGEEGVLLRAQPADDEAEEHAAAPLVGGGVLAAAVHRAAEVEQGRARLHLGPADLVRLGFALEVPAVAAGHHLGAAVLLREVGEREHRLDLEQGAGRLDVGPGVLVAVEHLRLLARADLDELAGVEQVVVAVLEQQVVGDAGHEGILHDRPEGARLRGQAVQPDGLLAVELDEEILGRVAQAGRDAGDRRVELAVEGLELFARKRVGDDDRAVLHQDGGDGLGRGGGGDGAQRGGHGLCPSLRCGTPV